MLKNYLKIAFRNLMKNKVYSLINISGLAIGMTATILIALWINDELGYNDYFDNKDSIAQVYQHMTFNGNTETGIAMPRPLEFALRKDYGDDFKHIVMASWQQTRYLRQGENNIAFEGNFMQEGAPEMLSLEIVSGVRDGLKELNSIMISESTAKAIFGDRDPIGKIVKMGDQYDLKVTAVYKDIPESTTFSYLHFIAPWKFYVTTQEWIKRAVDFWGNNSFQTYVQISGQTTMQAVSNKIVDIKKNNDADQVQFNPQLFLHPMKDWHLRSDFENGIQSGGRIENVWLFGIIGIFVLILACINFVNLSTARSEKRATEVGIRKSVGSRRGQLISQFLSESFLIVLISYMAALGLVLLFLNGFNDLASKSIEFPWTQVVFWGISILFIAITSFLAGSYPALYLSSFNPVSVLKGTFKAGSYAALPRKILVITQFTVSIALIIGTIVVMNQIDYAKSRPTGYNKDGLIQIPLVTSDFEGKADFLRNQFIQSGGAIDMAATNSPVTGVWSNQSGYDWEGKPVGFQEDFAYVWSSYELVETLGLEILEGRGFSRDFASDSTAVILNKTAVEYMGLKDPVGKLITYSDSDNTSPPMKIIGIVDDMVMESPYEPVKQTMYVFDRRGNESFYSIRLNPEKSTAESLALLEKVFQRNFPSLSFNYQFIDEQYGRKFRAEERIANLSKVFTLLAIFISCLGLFGLASFVAEQRTKEIGVRKTLGASVSQLWMLLSRDFVKLVVISLLIGSPVAYLLMNQWLQKFAYRTDISWTVFVIACSGALLITLITVSFQAIRTATTNPVDSLRTE